MLNQAEVLLTGLRIGESARWHDDRLWLANWGEQEVIAVDLEGNAEVQARVETTLPISIDWLPDGRLLIVSGPEGLILRREPDGSLVTHADLSGLSPHSWNEIVVDGRGHLYTNTINFDMMGGADPRPGLVALVTPDGTVRQVADGVEFPNGMVVTPDNSTLILAESYAKTLTAFDIDVDGSLSDRRVWAEVGSDGICLDAEGAVWAPAGKQCLRVSEGGEMLQAIDLDRFCFSCTLGGPDGMTLFMLVAEWLGPERMFDGPPTGQVVTARAPAPGAGWP